MMRKKTVISLQNISKTYTLHHEKPTFSERFFRREKKEQFMAINNISLDIYQGEKVGIIGSNGAGKTTLLKIIAGITTPTLGKAKTNGKIVSLIDLEAGFHHDLTGEENIFLNGLVIGMSRQEITKKFNKIVKFAGIGKFIDVPLYTYSEGMKLRLGFAIAVHADPDILLLDESLSVGDKDFQEKAKAKIQEFFKANKTIVLVTHELSLLRKTAKRIVWLHNHEVFQDGGVKIIEEYENFLGKK